MLVNGFVSSKAQGLLTQGPARTKGVHALGRQWRSHFPSSKAHGYQPRSLQRKGGIVEEREEGREFRERASGHA